MLARFKTDTDAEWQHADELTGLIRAGPHEFAITTVADGEWIDEIYGGEISEEFMQIWHNGHWISPGELLK